MWQEREKENKPKPLSGRVRYALTISFFLLAVACIFLGRGLKERNQREMWAMLMMMNLVAGAGFFAVEVAADRAKAGGEFRAEDDDWDV